MIITAYRRLSLILAGISVLLLVCILTLWAKYVREQNDMRDAWIATHERQLIRERILPKSTVDDDVELLSEYSHPVPKRSDPDFLYLTIQSENHQLIDDIIADLRKKTGKDLGDNPTNWIEKYMSDLIYSR